MISQDTIKELESLYHQETKAINSLREHWGVLRSITKDLKPYIKTSVVFSGVKISCDGYIEISDAANETPAQKYLRAEKAVEKLICKIKEEFIVSINGFQV